MDQIFMNMKTLKKINQQNKVMKKILVCLVFLTITTINLHAQKYFTKTGEISFFSSTPIEDIEALSKSAYTVYDADSGKIQWGVLIKSFEFEKALMQEHFNENYMESSKYPKAKFAGEIKNHENLNLLEDGTYNVDIEGQLTIHNETQNISTQAVFEIKDGVIKATSSFKALVADYKIEIPSVVKENIAKEIEITINADYAKLEK
jgi:hypothetical protein